MSADSLNQYNDDALFLERLDVFLEKSLDDLREFAHREGRDFEQIRLRTAEWHSKYIFEVSKTAQEDVGAKEMAQAIVDDVLDRTSKALESLEEVAGRHSLLLVVNPSSAEADEGFLGGTVLGREFWRGLRNGGMTGARNFKQFCRRSSAIHPTSQPTGLTMSSSWAKQSPAGNIKNNLYLEMRSRLRAKSGVRNAEMKWTKPGKLSMYGVALEGWPRDIEHKSPSKMTLNETTTLLKMLLENELYFRSLEECVPDSPGLPVPTSSTADVSWAVYEDDC